MHNTAAIVLNWNRPLDTIACLESLLRMTRVPDTIVVCDNGSSDNSRDLLPKWAERRFGPGAIRVRGAADRSREGGAEAPRFVYIQNDKNAGYAAGNNAALRYVLTLDGIGYLWILNNDTLVGSRALETLLDCAAAGPAVGIWGATICDYGDPERVECAGGCRYDPLTSIVRPAGAGQTLAAVLRRPAPPLDYVAGCSMFIARAVLEAVGLFSEEYFLYYEEIDFCRRAQAAGHTMAWCRGCLVVHKGGRSVRLLGPDTPPHYAAVYHETLSTLIFSRKFHPLLFAGTFIIRLAGKLWMIARRREGHLARAVIDAYRTFLRGGRGSGVGRNS